MNAGSNPAVPAIKKSGSDRLEDRDIEYVAMQANVPIGLAIIALSHSHGMINTAIELLSNSQFEHIAWREARESGLI